MDPTPPEPDFGVPHGMGITGEEFAFSQGGQQPPPVPRSRRISGSRLVLALIWAVVTIILAAGGIAELTIKVVGGAVVCFLFALLTGWYDYRIWGFGARRRRGLR